MFFVHDSFKFIKLLQEKMVKGDLLVISNKSELSQFQYVLGDIFNHQN